MSILKGDPGEADRYMRDSTPGANREQPADPLTEAAHRLLHEVSVYKGEAEKYGFAEDIELVARAILATQGAPKAEAPDRFDTPQGFLDWFGKNYYGEVVFSDPAWHARIIFRTAVWHWRSLAHAQRPAPDPGFTAERATVAEAAQEVRAFLMTEGEPPRSAMALLAALADATLAQRPAGPATPDHQQLHVLTMAVTDLANAAYQDGREEKAPWSQQWQKLEARILALAPYCCRILDEGKS